MLLDTMSIKKSGTRSRVLDAVLSLIADTPETALRMADIAKRAGISRQALYLHFATRTDLLVATTLYVDEAKDIDARLAASRTATSGEGRLDAYIDAWGNYIPEIYGIARVLLALKESGDEAAAAAWDSRMATDLLWTMLSVRNWEHLTIDCGWSQKAYIANLKSSARQLFVAAEAGE